MPEVPKAQVERALRQSSGASTSEIRLVQARLQAFGQSVLQNVPAREAVRESAQIQITDVNLPAAGLTAPVPPPPPAVPTVPLAVSGTTYTAVLTISDGTDVSCQQADVVLTNVTPFVP